MSLTSLASPLRKAERIKVRGWDAPTSWVAGLVKQAASALKINQYDLAIRYFTAALQLKPETKVGAAIYSWRATHTSTRAN